MPVRTTFTDAWPDAMDNGLQLAGVAGSGANNLVTLQPYTLVPTQYWFIHHMVMSSKGSNET